MSMFKCAKADF